MTTRSFQAIENYLNKFGDYAKNRKQALSLGIIDANSLKPADLNKKLAQKLYDMGWCVDHSGKLLVESKCQSSNSQVKTSITQQTKQEEKQGVFQRISQLFGRTSPRKVAPPAADGIPSRYYNEYRDFPQIYHQIPRYYSQSSDYNKYDNIYDEDTIYNSIYDNGDIYDEDNM